MVPGRRRRYPQRVLAGGLTWRAVHAPQPCPASFVQMLHDSFCSEFSIYIIYIIYNLHIYIFTIIYHPYTWNDDEDDDRTMIDNFELRDATNQFSRWGRVIKVVNMMKHMPSITPPMMETEHHGTIDIPCLAIVFKSVRGSGSSGTTC